MKFFQLPTIIAIAAALAIVPALQAADESAALAVLASSDTDLHAKAMACDELGRLGTARAVTVLAKLLADNNLHDYARDGLERIEDPAAGKALMDGLKNLKGMQRLGVIISLGDRRVAAAVPPLAKIARIEGKNQAVASAALTSLAQIASDEANEAILAVFVEGFAEARVLAAHAALAAAQQMERDGRKEAAEKLRAAAATAGVPAPIKKAAKK